MLGGFCLLAQPNSNIVGGLKTMSMSPAHLAVGPLFLLYPSL